jgi:pimeloyl-ACP methyl ester carboxylesterase
MSKNLINSLTTISCVVLLAYLAICWVAYRYQDDLLFRPQPRSQATVKEILAANPGFGERSYTMSDGTNISAYISKTTSIKKLPAVIYFGGNADEASYFMAKKKYFNNHALVLVNYRGFGLSGGIPSEKTMFSDALEIYDKLAAQNDIDPGHITIVGRSIGTGVATYLSSQRRSEAIILITPYESMVDVASRKFPFLPIQFLIKHPFNSKKYATSVNTEMLAIIAKGDNAIPKEHAYNLIKAWKGKVIAKEFAEDHESIMQNEDCWKSISVFVLEKIKST